MKSSSWRKRRSETDIKVLTLSLTRTVSVIRFLPPRMTDDSQFLEISEGGESCNVVHPTVVTIDMNQSLMKLEGYTVNLCSFCFYKIIGKLTVFFQLQEFN